MTSKTPLLAALAAIALLAPLLARAQATTFQDNFTGNSASNSWTAIDGACLTAGDGTGSIPACVGNSYYTTSQAWVGGNTGTLPDSNGYGALRLTNGCKGSGCGGSFNNGYNQAGGIISNTTYPTGSGLQITFTTYTYEGNSGGNGGGTGIDEHDGADGMSFFLLNGTVASPFGGVYDVGAFGGSLGYTCSDSNNDPKPHPDATTRHYDGLVGAYLGLGIDEYGNFLNPGDNTSTGPGLQAGRIGLRGAGSVSWDWLHATYPTKFPNTWTASQQATAVQNTCKSGYLEDYNGTQLTVSGQKVNLAALDEDYDAIPNAYKILSGVQIANESATKRSGATPITYDLNITQNGVLSLSYSINGGAYQPVLSPQYITNNNLALPASVRFGFAGSTGGSTNVHEILCFQVNPTQQADTSVGVNQKEATKIASGTQAFLAFYYPSSWSGDLTANSLQYDPATKLVSVLPTANWDATCNLTGSTTGCAATGATGTVTAQSPTSRVMLTWNGSQGIPFEWSSLSTAEQTTLDQGDTTPYNGKRLSYLRGDRTNEINLSGVGLYRARTSVLGDIIDSSPTWVGYPDAPYTGVWKDHLYPNNAPPENGTNGYAQYVTNEQTRTNVVYVGSNDGFLHGFRAGAFDASHNFLNNSTTPNDGQEVFAYMPGAVFQMIHNATDSTLDYSSAQYAHNFFVDATPDSDDLFYAGNWHTWLVGGLGAGGSAFYALNVSNPANFSESNASSLVIGEWTPATITCTNVANCGQNMGNTYGVPVVRRLHNGMWGVIFGNGYGSSTGDAGIYVMTVDPSSGSTTFYYLSTGQAGTNDGIAYPSPADFDGDNVADYVYAGDLNGHVWRFDLTSSNPGNWAATATPVFTDPYGHPITTKVTVGATIIAQGMSRVMVDFATGRKIPLSVNSAPTYQAAAQYLYGIWDWNVASWNAISSVKYADLTTPPGTITTSNLQVQQLSAASQSGVYDDTSNTVCWADGTSCSSAPQYGWYMALPNTSEQVIFNPLLYQGTLYVNTTIPPDSKPTDCKTSAETGDTIAISATTGGVVKSLFPDYSDANAAGQLTDPSGSPFVVLAAGYAYVMTQSTASTNGAGGAASGPFTCTAGNTKVCETRIAYHGASGKRLTWIEKR